MGDACSKNGRRMKSWYTPGPNWHAWAQIDSRRQPLLNEFKSDMLTQFHHCAACMYSCIAFLDKTKKVATLLDICPTVENNVFMSTQ